MVVIDCNNSLLIGLAESLVRTGQAGSGRLMHWAVWTGRYFACADSKCLGGRPTLNAGLKTLSNQLRKNCLDVDCRSWAHLSSVEGVWVGVRRIPCVRPGIRRGAEIEHAFSPGTARVPSSLIRRPVRDSLGAGRRPGSASTTSYSSCSREARAAALAGCVAPHIVIGVRNNRVGERTIGSNEGEWIRGHRRDCIHPFIDRLYSLVRPTAVIVGS